MNSSHDCWYAHELVPNVLDEYWVKLPLSIFYWLIFVLGLTGNIAASFVIVQYGTLRLLHGPYLLGLTIFSLILTIAGLPATAIQLLTRSWDYGEVSCITSALLQSTSLFAISLLLCAIALERYIFIVNHASTINSENGKAKHFLILVLISAVALLLSFPYFFYVKLIENYTDGNDTVKFCIPFCGEIWPNNSLRRCYNLVVIVAQFGMPIVSFALCYGGIIRTVKKQMRRRLAHSILSEELTISMQNRQRRLIRMLFSLIISFVLPWAAHNVLIIAEEFDLLKLVIEPEWLMTVTNIFHCIAMTYCIWNPLVYALFHPDIRNNLEKIRIRRRSVVELNRNGFRKCSTHRPNESRRVQISDVQL